MSNVRFAPVPFLRDLREECLQRSEKRMPKWKFRLAEDLVMQLQPKPTYLPTQRQIESGVQPKIIQFNGLAVQVETGTATADMLERSPNFSATAWWRRTFEIFAYRDQAEWQLQLGRWMCSLHGSSEIPAFDARLTPMLTDGVFFANLSPDRMLGHHCLICGKGLTDPASMARWIGPECAGTSSLTVPFVIAATNNHAA
jgi:hypothetical protein